jgi:hypothetical protein
MPILFMCRDSRRKLQERTFGASTFRDDARELLAVGDNLLALRERRGERLAQL